MGGDEDKHKHTGEDEDEDKVGEPVDAMLSLNEVVADMEVPEPDGVGALTCRWPDWSPKGITLVMLT